MNETTQTLPAPPLPDHLSADPRSPHHVAAVFEHDIGIRLNDCLLYTSDAADE